MGLEGRVGWQLWTCRSRTKAALPRFAFSAAAALGPWRPPQGGPGKEVQARSGASLKGGCDRAFSRADVRPAQRHRHGLGQASASARPAVAGLIALSLGWPVMARDGPQMGAEMVPLPEPRPKQVSYDSPALCVLIADAAEEHDLPPDFFARLIWKESRFDVKALSPVGAQGVAQFMPETARLRGLGNPWEPRQAIRASAHFLADLRAEFGNWGLAAAAYNGGPHRVADWLAHKGGLPNETIDYVVSITHRPVEWFREPGREVEDRPLEKGLDFLEGCSKLPVIATRAMGVPAARQPWGVQVATGINHSAAQVAFNRARKGLSSIIGGRGPIFVRSSEVAGERGYSVRIGAGSRREAVRLCRRIRQSGGACLIRRN